MDQRLATSLVTGALVIWVLYRRVRRTIGRQALNPRRLQLRSASLAILACLFAWNAVHDVTLIGALLLGMLAGAGLGQLGLRHTQFEFSATGHFYTPHTYIGVGVTAVLIARLIYRFMAIHPGAATVHAHEDPLASRSPLTLAIFGLLVGYYLFYYIGLLSRARSSQASAIGVGGAPDV